ncbi:hypothetical protein MHYP_G00347730 [Metynnis hypsauchen]
MLQALRKSREQKPCAQLKLKAAAVKMRTLRSSEKLSGVALPARAQMWRRTVLRVRGWTRPGMKKMEMSCSSRRSLSLMLPRSWGAMLDSCISEVSSETPQPRHEACENGDRDDDDDEGFRLFSTSLPGNWRKEPTPPPAPKRPPAPSSSDTDSEMESRFREAAVSISDLIPPSTEKSKEKEGINSGEKDERSKEGAELKKKKKKKKAAAEGEETCSKGREAVSHEQSAEEHVMKKKKKKKRIRLDEGE